MKHAIHWPGLHWQSDWRGDEVGYPECEAVGLYSFWTTHHTEKSGTLEEETLQVNLYIDLDTDRVLETWAI